MVDDDLWWVFCGNECSGHFVGPFDEEQAAAGNAERTDCQHDHVVFRLSLMQMAGRLPASARLWDCGIYDARTTPTTLLIARPKRPLEAYHRWPVFATGLVTLKEWTCV